MLWPSKFLLKEKDIDTIEDPIFANSMGAVFFAEVAYFFLKYNIFEPILNAAFGIYIRKVMKALRLLKLNVLENIRIVTIKPGVAPLRLNQNVRFV